MKIKFSNVFLTALACIIQFSACTEYAPDPEPQKQRKVFLLYADGFSNLTPYMQSDIAALEAQAPCISLKDWSKLLVFQHFTASAYDYDTPTPPVLLDIYVGKDGMLIRDTVKVWPKGTHSSDAAMMKEVLTLVHDMFPAAEYGMSYSSHGTGWLPQRYYDRPIDPIFADSPLYSAGREDDGHGIAAGAGRTLTGPAVYKSPSIYKSIGCEPTDCSLITILEMKVTDFAAAIPFRLDYLILDACLMGGIETMYQLRNKTRYILSSQTEIRGGGFYYENMLNSIFYRQTTDLKKICAEYIASMSEASVSLVDCDALEDFAACCRSLFEKYRSGIYSVKPSSVQGFFQDNKHWFYDLVDIMEKSGIDAGDAEVLKSALRKCVLYVDHSSRFGTITLGTDCGMSMCLPSNASSYLLEYYKDNYDWNKATGLVK